MGEFHCDQTAIESSIKVADRPRARRVSDDFNRALASYADPHATQHGQREAYVDLNPDIITDFLFSAWPLFQGPIFGGSGN